MFRFLFFLLIPFSILASDEIANLHYKKGDVVLIRNGEERFMIKGEKIYEGDILETGSKSLAIVSFMNSSKMKLSSKSSITIEKVMGSAKSKTGAYLSLYQKAGTSLIKFLNESKKNDLEVRTRKVSIAVRGTKFLVGYGRGKEAGDLYTYVDEGKVTAMNFELNDHIDVPGGKGIYIDREGKISEPRELPWAKKLNMDVSGRDTRSIGFYRKEVRQDRQRFRPRLQQTIERRKMNPFKNKPGFKKWNNFRKIKNANENILRKQGRLPEQMRQNRRANGLQNQKMNRPGDKGPGEPDRGRLKPRGNNQFRSGKKRDARRRDQRSGVRPTHSDGMMSPPPGENPPPQ